MENNYISNSITSDDNPDGEDEKASDPNVCGDLGVVSSNPESIEFHVKDRSNSGKVYHNGDPFEDESPKNRKDGHNEGGNVISANDTSFISNWETNILVWLPPDPEDKEDDKEGDYSSLVNNADDEDDDYTDDTEWGYLSSPGVDHGISYTYRKEREKAMKEAMDGQFKFLVSRFLASEGIACSEQDGGESWLNIVAFLSWEAALLVKPVANEGKEMDPASYVKVKCIAHGSRNESEVIKGFVFKKNTAHKHMPTEFKNPRLLLLKGGLGDNATSLSSFKTMTQERDQSNPVINQIETCHPNVVLVEKTSPRDVQESLMKKGITLVFDMKLPRLERIARSTGSPIISSADININTKLRRCGYFHIVKFVEDHNQTTDGGKKMSKNLMFFEGCPKPLGCTILLKGAHSDELKKIKRVMHFTIFAAYHLILETSFFADQRVSLGTHSVKERSPCENKLEGSAFTVEIPDSNEDMDKPDLDGVRQNSDIVIEGYSSDVTANGVVSNGVDQQEKTDFTTSKHLQLHPAGSFDFIASDLGYNEKYQASYHENDQYSQDISLHHESPTLETIANETEVAEMFDEGKTHDESSEDTNIQTVSDLNESLEHVADVNSAVSKVQKGDIDVVLDPQSILILYSSRSILKDTICDQSHLIRIKYYGNFDKSLGRYLQDTLLSQTHKCEDCGESPESHIYCYTHQNGNLSVQVKPLPVGLRLLGAKEGKIWMWTRCLKCNHESGIPRPTKRVVMSTAAHGLSFGKFLELSFSSHSPARRLLSRCGHLLHRDCLRFFGFGSKVAMFRYSPVEIYAACKPPPKLDFTSFVGQEWFVKEVKHVQRKGRDFFSEVECLLKKIQPNLSSKPVNLPGFTRTFSEVEEMLRQEKAEFEMITTSCGLSGQSTSEIFDLTYLNQELFLQLYVWDCRFRSHMSNAIDNDATLGSIGDKKILEQGVSLNGNNEENSFQEDEKNMDNPDATTSINIEEPDGFDHHSKNTSEVSAEPEISTSECSKNTGEFIDAEKREEFSVTGSVIASAVHEGSSSLCDEKPGGVTSPMQIDIVGKDVKVDNTSCSPKVPGQSFAYGEDLILKNSVNIAVEAPEDMWAPFQEIRKAFWKGYSQGYLRKFEFILRYSPEYLSPLKYVISQERECLYYPMSTDAIVISIHEEEVSSIIACALVKDRYTPQDEKEFGNDERYADNEIEDIPDVTTSSFWSSNGLNFERIHSSQSISSVSSDDPTNSNYEGSFFATPQILHSEVQLGIANDKSKYSVICIYAKQFHALRSQCCPSETAYISSLSRCKKWDAQGGKSKALFSKTLDDRFIIKEIKKTELASFLKFAPEYFEHVSQSLRTGSQTCLAKVLGIYQVRQSKGGKESYLMVMENLLFGRTLYRTYDLKGVVFRNKSDPNNPGVVLWDQNFVEHMSHSPMYVGGKTKHMLQRAIWNDTSFLTSMNVMDYSLLVGVDKERRQLVFGIIDYLRQYTWDKQLETWVKASFVGPKNSLPTVITPKEYKKRFRKFMSRYFLTVPDSWTTDQSTCISASQKDPADLQENPTKV